MTVPELLQLYAPLAGLLALAFWVGVLSQKVKDQGEDIRDLKSAGAEGGVTERLVRLEVNSENATESLKGMERSLQGIQRQLGNLMHKGASITEMNA